MKRRRSKEYCLKKNPILSEPDSRAKQKLADDDAPKYGE